MKCKLKTRSHRLFILFSFCDHYVICYSFSDIWVEFALFWLHNVISLILNICVINFRHFAFERAGNRAFRFFFIFLFRFSLHPVLCVVRSVDESHDVLLLQMTEIEIQNNHTEKCRECLPNTLLKNMLFYSLNAFYTRPSEGWVWGAIYKGQQEQLADSHATSLGALLHAAVSFWLQKWQGQDLEHRRSLFLDRALVWLMKTSS